MVQDYKKYYQENKEKLNEKRMVYYQKNREKILAKVKQRTEERIFFTDEELYCIALAIETHLNHKDTFFTEKSAKVFNKMVQKVIDFGLRRENPKSILHPIKKFD